MKKIEVSNRVLKNGEPLRLELFSWDENTRTFSSDENNLVIDFNTKNDCTFKTGSGCTFKTGSNCTFNTGYDCTFDTISSCTFDTRYNCTFKTGSDCTFKTGSNCTFDTRYNCTFKTGSYCTFDTISSCTFDTRYNCTFDTGSDCAFKTGSNCTFKTEYNCTFKTGNDCTFKTGIYCVIGRRDVLEVIILKEEQNNIKLCPYNVKGYLIEDKLFIDNIEQEGSYIIADNILSKIISKKSNIYKVQNYDSDKITYLVKQDNIYSHGDTLQEAKDSLTYKISNKDTSIYKDYSLKTILTKEEAIKMYRIITGACEAGTRYFIENLKEVKEKYSIKEIIKVTKGQYGNESLVKFFS